MNSYLITGGTPEERFTKAREIIFNFKFSILNFQNHPDILIVKPSPSIGIAQIRQLQKFLSLKPHQATIKAVIVPEAERLTLAAQSAFLKTLEEPPAHSIIILCVPSKEALLPTIVSRCQIMPTVSKPPTPSILSMTNHYSLITKILRSGAGERLKLIESHTKTRQDAVKFCEEMIVALRHLLTCPDLPDGTNLPNLPNEQLLTIISSFQEAVNLLNSNANVKLSLDNLVICLPPFSPCLE